MFRFRRTLFGAAALLVALVTQTGAAAAGPEWQPGPNAVGEYSCNGVIDAPAAGATIASGAPIQVSGWIVDMSASGWAGFDDLHVYDGVAGSGRFLTQGAVGLSRPDVALALSNPFAVNSGFMATIPGGMLGVGSHTLSVYAHTPDKGWWYQQLNVSVAEQAATTSDRPVGAISKPEYGENVYTGDETYTVIGYALDPRATMKQGSQNTGIDRVQVYINDSYVGDADLAFSEPQAATYGSQFANAGFRFVFKPTALHEGNNQLEVRAHSVLGGQELSIPTTFTIIEGDRPND